jgi:hypothetical protein
MAASLRRLDFEVEAQYATVLENSPAVSVIVASHLGGFQCSVHTLHFTQSPKALPSWKQS